MSSGKLITRHAYGVRSHSKNCLSYLDDHHLMYVAGNNVVIMSTETKDQSFIPGTVYPQRGLGITCISSSHPKKIIAVAEKTADNGIVTFYDSHSLRKKKTINHADLGSKEITSMAFSNDGKYFIMQGGAPEWNLCLWNIEKNIKLIYTFKSCHHEDQTVSAISFCPSDHTIMGVFGKSMGKLLKYQEGHIKAMSMSMRRDHANFTAHLWTVDDRCIVGTEAGEILLIDNLEFRTVIYPCGNDGEDFVPILSMAETSRGFVVGSISGELRVFEKAEDSKEQYSYADMYVLPNETSNVISLAMGLDDNVVSLTDSQQMFVCPLYSGNMVVKDKTQITFDNIISSFHYPNSQNSAAIVSIDVAVWRPLLATCGKDCTARVWNLHERKVEVMLKYEEEPIAVGLHPSGLYMIVAFLDKIQVLSILLNELSHTRDLSIRQCSIVKFSKGGNFLGNLWI
jgi:cilia- and flagella-associated protein 57